tara:strand:+ start:13113 stop:13496 length:384 start_codon:yes stop_codon:yes gene_type:complete
MINNFLIINCIGKNDKLGLRINKDFFVYNLKNKKIDNENLVNEIFDFINNHNVIIDENFSVIVNQGPGSFSRSRISLSVAKGLKITKKVKLFGYRNNDLKVFDQQNIENLFHANLIEKKLIKPIYLS